MSKKKQLEIAEVDVKNKTVTVKESIWAGEVGDAHIIDPQGERMGFTGIARSVECYDNSGFRNFRILTLHIQDGLVINIERSDPYANFEAISRLEMANEIAVIHLNNTWQNGRTLSK